MNRQLSITLETKSEYKNCIDKYEIQMKNPHLFQCSHIIPILILGIGISYLYFNQLKKCLHMYIWNTALFCQKKKNMGNGSS